MKKSIIIFISIIAFFHLYSNDLLPYIPFQGNVKEIKTEHFIIIFPEEYSETGKKVAGYSEEIHEKLSTFMNWKPFERTNIILSDNTDLPNGLATPCPRNTIVLYLAPAELEETLKSEINPLYSIIVHEYTHILHLDQIRGAAWFWRITNGKLYFPVSQTFSWYYEGTAVLTESRNSTGGRLGSGYNEAIVREAAKNKKIPSFDKLVFPVTDWPNGNAAYHYGAKFIQYLYDIYGKEKFDEIYINVSKEFWPFIMRFAMSFEKIYGKSLNDLWDDWIKYEEENVKIYPDPEISSTQITNLEGEIPAINKNEKLIYFAGAGYKNDKYLYKLDYSGEVKNKPEKLINGYLKSVTITNHKDLILYTKLTGYPDNFTYYDLYSFNVKTKIEKKLTFKQRASFVSFSSQKNIGVFVCNTGKSAKIYKFELENGKIKNKEEINISENIRFIDEPSINNDGNKVVFSARTSEGLWKIYFADVDTGECLSIEKISGVKAKFIDNNNFSFILNENNSSSMFLYNLESKEVFKILSTQGLIINGFVNDNKIYTVNYTSAGEEIFVYDLKDKEKIQINFEENKVVDKTFEINNNDYEIKNFNFFRNLYPSVWAFLPYQLDDSYYALSLGNSFLYIPFFAPEYIIYNTTPLGNFNYVARVGLDYLRWYPDNSLSLNFKFPVVDITYNWKNWMSGQKVFNNNIFYENKFDNRYPICFSNNISIDSDIPLGGYGNIFFGLSVTHRYEEYNFNKEKQTNTISFSENIGYYYINSRIKSSRWDRGIYINIFAYQSPEVLFDNNPVYIIKGKIEGRIPFLSTFFFTKIEGGKELYSQNIFSATTDVFKISENILGSGNSNYINQIDTKAFTKDFSRVSYGSAFVSADIGLDITVYKKTHYWHFATLGFKEFFIKTYSEIVYLYNADFGENQTKGIIFDHVLELGIDLFAAYGNISGRFVAGGAVGYRIGDDSLSWSVFGSISFGLGY